MTDFFFSPIEPFNTFQLNVSKLHTIHIEESGNKNGKPVIFLHGGPGGGAESIYRQYFDPNKWRIIIFDQRGCGKSTPSSELTDNTTWDLVSDIEKIRKYLNISCDTYRSSQLGIESRGNQKLVDICNLLGADSFIVKPGTEHYHPQNFFRGEGIRLVNFQSEPLEYPQQYGEFISNLSALYYIMNMGPNKIVW